MTCLCSLDPHLKLFLGKWKMFVWASHSVKDTTLRKLHQFLLLYGYNFVCSSWTLKSKPGEVTQATADARFSKLFRTWFLPEEALALQPGVVRGIKPSRPEPPLTFPSLVICFFICVLPKRTSGGMPSKITSKISRYPQPPQHKGNQYHWCLGLLWWRGFQKEVMWEDLTPAEIAECQELVPRGSPHSPHTKPLFPRSSPHL